MAQKKQSTFWWSVHDMLTYNRIFNFVLGNRGAGKTFACKEWMIRDFLKNGNEAVYVRRYKTEMHKVLSGGGFFADIVDKFPDHQITVKGHTAYIDGNAFCYFIELSTSAQAKSSSFPKVNKIIFDEFIIDKGGSRYLSNEVEVFLELFETVARMRENVRAVFIANAVSMVNPYFSYFELLPVPGQRFTCNESILIETVINQEYREAKNATRFGRLIAGTKYAEYAIENEALRDNNEFIMKRPDGLSYMCGISFKGHDYGIWRNLNRGLIFVDKKCNIDSRFHFCVTAEDGKPNFLLLKYCVAEPVIQILREMFSRGIIYYSDQETKMDFYAIMSLLNVR